MRRPGRCSERGQTPGHQSLLCGHHAGPPGKTPTSSHTLDTPDRGPPAIWAPKPLVSALLLLFGYTQSVSKFPTCRVPDVTLGGGDTLVDSPCPSKGQLHPTEELG